MKIRIHFQRKKNFLWTILVWFFLLLLLPVSCTGDLAQEEAPGPPETTIQEGPPSEEQPAPGGEEQTAEVPGQEPGQAETEEDLRVMDEWCPSWSPDGSRIVFIRSSSPVGSTPGERRKEIWIANLKTEKQRQLANLNSEPKYLYRSSDLVWSSDGTFLVYQDEGGAKGNAIYRIEMEKLTRTELATQTDLLSSPSLSSDNSSLLIAKSDGVYLLDLETREEQRKIEGEGIHDVVWGKEEKEIFFTQANGTGFEAEGEDLLMMDLESQEVKKLASYQLDIQSLSYLKEIDRLFYVIVNGGRGDQITALIDPRKAKPFQLSLGIVEGYSLYRDGKLLIQAEYPQGAAPGENMGGIDLFLIDLSDVAKVTKTNLTNSEGIGEIRPSFSPDGKRIAFQILAEQGKELWVMNADGTEQTRLLSQEEFPNFFWCSPSWSPDSQLLASGTNQGGNDDLLILDTQGKVVKNISQEFAVIKE